MEAPQPGSRGLGQRRGGRDAPLYFGIRSNVSRAQASSAHRPPKFAGLRARRFAGWLSFRAPHSLDLQGGRPVSEIADRSEEHTSELQSLTNLVCRLLLEKKNK